MHALHLLRHAKSNPDDTLDDHDRPLSRRGRETARRLGAGLPATAGPVDLVLCSTARRTRETAALALAGFRPPPRILFEDRLYLASRGTLLRRLKLLDEDDEAVLVIGHNPGLQALALLLADPDSPGYEALAAGKFPTGARASFAIEGRWDQIDRTHHALTAYVAAKSLAG
jgi:phosphohistidine phosphatase